MLYRLYLNYGSQKIDGFIHRRRHAPIINRYFCVTNGTFYPRHRQTTLNRLSDALAQTKDQGDKKVTARLKIFA
jgi:hypothetical protein